MVEVVCFECQDYVEMQFVASFNGHAIRGYKGTYR